MSEQSKHLVAVSSLVKIVDIFKWFEHICDQLRGNFPVDL